MSLICLIPSVLQFIFFNEVNADSESVKIRVFFFELLAYLQADSTAAASDVYTDAYGASKLNYTEACTAFWFGAIDEYKIVIIEFFEYSVLYVEAGVSVFFHLDKDKLIESVSNRQGECFSFGVAG